MPSMKLLAPALAALRDAPAPAHARFLPRGRKLLVAAGAAVKIGTPLAASADGLSGDVHSSVAGEVTAAGPELIVVKNSGATDAEAPVQLGQDVDSLRAALSAAGVNAKGLVHARTLIINCLNHEPGVWVNEQALLENAETLAAGLDALRRIVNPSEVVAAVPAGRSSPIQGARASGVEPFYPAGVNELVAFAVTGSERPESVIVIDADRLYNVGAVAKTGLPLTSRIVTVNGANFRVRIGTTLADLAPLLGAAPADGDRGIFGGPMRGFAQYSFDAPVDKDTLAVTLVKKGAFPPVTSDACTNCGECTRKCPARLQAALIGRYAEFRMFEDAQKLGIEHCFECGMCSYWCPARRPMLQYMRYAKSELARIAECLALQEKAIECDAVEKVCEEVPQAKCPEGQPGEPKQG